MISVIIIELGNLGYPLQIKSYYGNYQGFDIQSLKLLVHVLHSPPSEGVVWSITHAVLVHVRLECTMEPVYFGTNDLSSHRSSRRPDFPAAGYIILYDKSSFGTPNKQGIAGALIFKCSQYQVSYCSSLAITIKILWGL